MHELTGAHTWWGEAPDQPQMFAKLPVSFYYIVRKADSWPSRGPSAMQLKSFSGSINRLLGLANQGSRLGGVSARSAIISVHAINPCAAFWAVQEPRPTKLSSIRNYIAAAAFFPARSARNSS